MRYQWKTVNMGDPAQALAHSIASEHTTRIHVVVVHEWGAIFLCYSALTEGDCLGLTLRGSGVIRFANGTHRMWTHLQGLVEYFRDLLNKNTPRRYTTDNKWRKVEKVDVYIKLVNVVSTKPEVHSVCVRQELSRSWVAWVYCPAASYTARTARPGDLVLYYGWLNDDPVVV